MNLLKLDFTAWTTWLVIGVGLTAASLTLAFTLFLARVRRRRRLAAISREEDLNWEDLLELLKQHKVRKPGAPPSADDEELPDSLLEKLLPSLPKLKNGEVLPEEKQFLDNGGSEKRAHKRRWGNPIEAQLTSIGGTDRHHGIVINRSTGGLAILVDRELQSGAALRVRAGEAPYYVPSVEIEICYCRRVGKHYLAGCKFRNDVPWNVRVWFG